MQKAKPKKICAKDCVKQLRCNIKTMRAGRMTEMQTVFQVFDALEIKHFGRVISRKIRKHARRKNTRSE
jgi:hypothetical protein